MIKAFEKIGFIKNNALFFNWYQNLLYYANRRQIKVMYWYICK